MFHNNVKKIIIVAGIFFLVILFFIYFYNNKSSVTNLSMFQNDIESINDTLKSQIDNVSIYSLALDEKIKLSSTEINELSELMQKIVLLDNSNQDFLDYSGCQYKMFNIQFSNGTTFDLSTSNPFIILNGEVGFLTQYTPCDEIFKFYHNLVEVHFGIN